MPKDDLYTSSRTTTHGLPERFWVNLYMIDGQLICGEEVFEAEEAARKRWDDHDGYCGTLAMESHGIDAPHSSFHARFFDADEFAPDATPEVLLERTYERTLASPGLTGRI